MTDSQTQTPESTAAPTPEPPVDMNLLDEIIDRYGAQGHMALQMLLDINNEMNYLPADALRHLAARVGMPESQVYSLATFFKAFSLEPRGKHIIHCCMGTACHVKGATQVVKKVSSQLGISDGETTPDLMFTLETVNCLGACALAPVVVADEVYHGEVTPPKIEEVIKKLSAED